MSSQPSFSQTLFRYLEKAELILVAALAASLLARYLQMDVASTALKVSGSCLAAVYFLMAYRPPAVKPTGEIKGMADLAATTILPKVLWIGCAVGINGIMFYLLPLPGAQQMLQIHALAGGLGLGMFLALKNRTGAQELSPVLYRAAPILLITIFFLASA